jgi:hypothetical protein
MTTQAQAEEAILARFVTQWGTTTPFVLENESFDEPSDLPWARLTIRETSRVQETMGSVGNRKFRISAIVFVQVYTRTNTGVQQGGTLATQAKDIFEATSFSGLDFNNGTVRKSGPDGKWLQTLAEIEFDYEEIK